MTRSHLLLPSLALLALASARAQSTAPPPPASRSAEPVGPVTATEWSAPRSRALFASLDGNGDDRLDLLEAAGLKTLAGVSDLDSFRRLDSDRDGFLDQEEFDAHFRDLLAHGQVLRLRPARPGQLVAEEGPPAPSDPAEKILALFDGNGDRELDQDETGKLLQQMGASPALASQIGRLDRDGSGAISVTEFRPLLTLLPTGLLPDVQAPPPRSRLPGGFGSQDLDRDGRLDDTELGRFLWRLDPSLMRWQHAILQHADRNGDGALDAAEIERGLDGQSATSGSGDSSRV